MIQEFHVSITALSGVGQDAYLLRTEAVAPGVPLAETQVTWPVEDWLQQATVVFQDPLQALLMATDDASDAGASAPWIQLGQALYNGIFQGRMRDSWLAALGVAQHRRQPLRLRLGFKDSRLQRLPWELLYGDDRPLATGVDITLCRYYQPQGAADIPPVTNLSPSTTPIQVLVVVSAPDDQERLALGKEVRDLIAGLQRSPQSNGHGHAPLSIELTVLEQPSRPELVEALEQGNFQVLHYAGHSDVSAGGGDLFLVNRQTGLTDWLSGEDLAGLLVNNGIQLAVFNSCRGAYTPEDDAQSGWREQNLVQALVNRGVSGVIAMAERIPDDVAITFTQLLYRNLRQGYPIDLCLSRVRQGLISAYRSDQSFWMLPILYLRPDFNGYLYALGDTDADPLDLDRDGLLIAPDYSSDPDISTLAREVFARHDAPAEQPSEGSSGATGDWLVDLDPANLPAAADATAVTDLVQRLSQPPDPQPSAPTSQTADPGENLLPQWDSASPILTDRLPPPPTADSPATAQPSEPTTVKPAPPRFWASLTQGLPPGWLWGGVGLAGLVAVLGVSLALFSRWAQPPTLVTDPAPSGIDRDSINRDSINRDSIDRDRPAPPVPGQNTAVMTSALNAFTTGNLAAARRLMEQLLDQQELATADSVLAAAEPDQLMDPDIAYIRGRVAWQHAAVGSPDYSLNDAQRAWEQAVETQANALEAQVGLGFAHYALGDYELAAQAWQQAVDIDRSHLRDIDPQGRQQVSSPLTVYAYAGLAMVHQKQRQITADADLKAQHLRQGQAFFAQAIDIDHSLLDPNRLAVHWLWTPTLIQDWRTTTSRLSVPHDSEVL
ncbi:CHAT domain-containing protein [Nodosilinea sp. P-1105]|uniref:CHAT domain-containing protein n=1 Tax=Nodosilinea sp. P-1105 TaxID=2546229 RepID=UPI00146A9CE8|nr:CHAT domain-containing protein [Nodosilinea sp. P-1105]